ncbi:MAG: hypothetical protein NWQ46_05510, partial [Spirosomaceae bacterium]|nr:hypothetical protein [Spirosomataceae bacterium]
MNHKLLLPSILLIGLSSLLSSCTNTPSEQEAQTTTATAFPSSVLTNLNHWNLILGDGSNVGVPIDFENKD